MKKTKLLKLLTVGSLSTVAVIIPLITTLASCNKQIVTGTKEIIASDGITKIILLDNSYRLTKPFSEYSRKSFIKWYQDEKQESIKLMGASNCFDNKTIVNNTSFISMDSFYFLKNDFIGFSNLFKINDKQIPYQTISVPSTSSCPETSYLLNWSSSKQNFVFTIDEIKIKKLNKSITFNLTLKLIENGFLKWIANLGEFILINVL